MLKQKAVILFDSIAACCVVGSHLTIGGFVGSNCWYHEPRNTTSTMAIRSVCVCKKWSISATRWSDWRNERRKDGQTKQNRCHSIEAGVKWVDLHSTGDGASQRCQKLSCGRYQWCVSGKVKGAPDGYDDDDDDDDDVDGSVGVKCQFSTHL